jgi:amino acid permease
MFLVLISGIAFIFSLFNLQKIKWISYIAIIFFLYIGLVIIIQTPSYMKLHTNDPPIGKYPTYLKKSNSKELNYFSFNSHFFQNLGLCFFVFTKQFALITILKIIDKNPEYHSTALILRAQYFPLILYSFVLIGGYFSFIDQMPEMLALRKPLPGSKDIAMTIGQIGLFTGISVSIILRIKFNSDYIKSFFSNFEQSPSVDFLIKLLCILVPLLISIFVEQNVFKLISTFASLLCPYFIIIVPGKLQVAFCNFQVFSILNFKRKLESAGGHRFLFFCL